MSLKDRIARQREALAEVKTQDVEVVLDGELATVTLKKALPDEWDLLVSSNPPRPGVEADAMVGYNSTAVSKGYPNVVVDGESVDAETWADLFSVLDSVHRNNLGVVIWGVNINESLRQMRELGKARAGQSSPLPAN